MSTAQSQPSPPSYSPYDSALPATPGPPVPGQTSYTPTLLIDSENSPAPPAMHNNSEQLIPLTPLVPQQTSGIGSNNPFNPHFVPQPIAPQSHIASLGANSTGSPMHIQPHAGVPPQQQSTAGNQLEQSNTSSANQFGVLHTTVDNNSPIQGLPAVPQSTFQPNAQAALQNHATPIGQQQPLPQGMMAPYHQQQPTGGTLNGNQATIPQQQQQQGPMVPQGTPYYNPQQTGMMMHPPNFNPQFNPAFGYAPPPFQVTSPMHVLGPGPGAVQCPVCGVKGVTRITYETGSTTHLWAVIACAFICMPCIPYLVNDVKDVRHYCSAPACGVALATWQRSGGTIVHAFGQMN